MRRSALVVGVNRYVDVRLDLNGCVADAVGMANLLRNHVGLKSDEIVLLLNQDATGANIREALWELAGRSANEDLILFYFAGRGTKIESRPNYEPHRAVVPHDLELRAMLREAEIAEIVRHGSRQSPTLVNIFDCCFEGRPLLNWAVEAESETLVSTVENRCLACSPHPVADECKSPLPTRSIYACRDHEIAAEVVGLDTHESHGVFSYHLQQILEQNPVVPVDRLCTELGERVRRSSTYPQTPHSVGFPPGASLFSGR